MRNAEWGTRNRSVGGSFPIPNSAFRIVAAPTAAPAVIKNSRRSIFWLPSGSELYYPASMQFETRIEPLDGKLPKVTYRWDPETDILTVACKGVAKGNGMNGTVDLEGGDGSFVVIDVAGGAMRGVDVVTWPDDVRTVATLQPPETSKEGQVTFPDRRSQPGVAAVELDTALTVDKNQTESVFHIRVGRQRPATIVRVADHMLVEIDKQSRLAGLWLLEVPPFPNVEATA